jgi:hypothetical protein
MAFSEIEIERIKKIVGSFCKALIPVHHRHQVSLDYDFKAHTVTLYEISPNLTNPIEIQRKAFSRIRWVQSRKIWSLFYLDADLKWLAYHPLPQVKHLDQAIAEISSDRYGYFLLRKTLLKITKN